ncbi:MAG: immune inhibitor A, partial [Muribaculaceae bacterium]|nr:immune inhibitor A [Muribaculaceae bacterium]
VFFYYAGYGKADSETETIWPHQFDYRFLGSAFGTSNLRFDGKRIGPYACANELKGWNPVTQKNPWLDGSEPWVDGIGTFVHEYGHVLGLPDLYDVNYTEGVAVDTPGDWDVMDSGCYNFDGCVPPLMSAYEQWVCRWLEYTDAEDATHYDIKALGTTDTPTAVRIRIPSSEDGEEFAPEYFLVEARDNSNWDACFPQSGLLVWRINYSKGNWINNSVNSAKGSNVKIVYAKNQRFPIFTEGSIYGGGDVDLVPTKEYPFWKSPVITDIAYDASSRSGSFDYNKVVASDLFTVLHDTPEPASNGSRAFRLTWDPVDGVDGYLVTVRLRSSGRVIGDFDAKNVGKETSVWVTGLSSTYWRLEMEAFVKCVVNGMPSTSSSNVVVFKPSELPMGNNAVEGVGGDTVEITGGVGCINAPEGAEVYDMAGKRLSKDRLAPGIYLVVCGGCSYKVLVR